MQLPSSKLEYLLTTEKSRANKKKLLTIPQSPGVYLHKDEDGKVLYVGKAKNLKARLKSYFSNSPNLSPKNRALVAKICDFEVRVTANEHESLLLEDRLIKQYQPPYNILLRDDKTYPYLKIDLKETWPRLVKTRVNTPKKGVLYFGPYTSVTQMYHIVDVLSRYFLLIKCRPSVFKTVSRPCQYYDINKCLAPCKLNVDKKEYKKQVDAVVAILSGKFKEVLSKIKAEIRVAAKDMNYEKAKILRDQLEAVTTLSEEQIVTLAAVPFEKKIESEEISEEQSKMLAGLQKILGVDFVPSYIECYDISTLQGTNTVASRVVFQNAKPLKSAYRKYIIRENVNHTDDFSSLCEVMQRRFRSFATTLAPMTEKRQKPDRLPDLVIIDGGTPQVREVSRTLKFLKLDKIPIVGIAKSHVQSNFTEKQVEKSWERLVIPKRDANNELLPDEEPDVKILTPGSPEFRLVTQLRDEAHRFAITFHKHRRSRDTSRWIPC